MAQWDRGVTGDSGPNHWRLKVNQPGVLSAPEVTRPDGLSYALSLSEQTLFVIEFALHFPISF